MACASSCSAGSVPIDGPGYTPQGGDNPEEKPSDKPQDQETPADTVRPAQPNIILILTDDLGYSDIGCYGSEISTPCLDRLASEGVRYRTFYNAARSSPTRASLLTGLYPHQAGVGSLQILKDHDHYKGYLVEETHTMAELLRPAGYRTIFTGKWQLQPSVSLPCDRGFDHCVSYNGGWYWGDDPEHGAKLYYEGKEIPHLSDSLPGGTSQWYTTDMFVTMGLNWVDEALADGSPFFWYLPFNAVHYPLMAHQETIDKYTGKYMEGYTTVRERRFAKQMSLGFFSPGALSPENPHKKFRKWSSLSAEEKVREDLRMAIYAACMEEMDTNVGRVLDYLDAKGLTDNTLIIFLSDNGGNAEGGWSGAWDVTGSETPGGPGTDIKLSAPWAGVANTPFFLYKHHAHNGGCCTPLIMRWPEGMSASVAGTIDKDNYGHIVDLLPTLLDAAGAEYPIGRISANGTYVRVPAAEGVSLLPSLKGRTIARTKPIIVEHEGHKMLRSGDWKIVREYEFDSTGAATADEKDNPWRLYNVKNDPSEMTDLASKYPEKVAELKALYESESARTYVDNTLIWKVGGWYVPVRDYFK